MWWKPVFTYAINVIGITGFVEFNDIELGIAEENEQLKQTRQYFYVLLAHDAFVRTNFRAVAVMFLCL